MTDVKKPSQSKLRAYLYERHQSKAPPPTPEEVRRQLGWEMKGKR